MSRRQARAHVTKAEITRALAALREAGGKVAHMEVLPGGVKFTTTDGQNLTLPDNDAELDAELAEHRKKRGYG